MVTGIITTYAREPHIVERAIQSMLQQTYPLLEVIVVDDNKDESMLSAQIKAICSKFEMVKYYKQNGNQGACAARNLGIQIARGEYIAFLDDDDIWLPDKISKQMNAFKLSDERVGMVYCCGIRKDESTGEETDYYNGQTFKNRLTFKDMLLYDYVGSTSQPLIRKRCFETVGDFWVEQPARQDYEMWIRISQKYDIIGIKNKLFVHTMHAGEQISCSSEKGYIGYVNIYKRYKSWFIRNPRALFRIRKLIFVNKDKNQFEKLIYNCIRKIRNIVLSKH